MVDDSSSSLNRIKETQSESTFQPGLEAYTLYINAILFAWNVLWSKSKQKKKTYCYFFLLTHIVLTNKRQVYSLDKWVLKKKGNVIRIHCWKE